MGFGIFNSVAVAAAHAVTPADGGGLGLQRVLIVDWDIHHGNGTQQIFAEDDRVLYFSVHGLYRYPAFVKEDWERHSGPTYVGGARAQGRTINVAWTGEGYGDAEYAALWERLLMPVAREFEPELVIISAGFDSAAGDEEGYQCTPVGYAYLTSELQKLASGRIVVVLEGGYNIPAISYGFHACVAALAGLGAAGDGEGEVDTCSSSNPWQRSGFGDGNAQAIEDIELSIAAQRPYWSCLR